MLELQVGDYKVTVQKTTDHNLYRVTIHDKKGKVVADSNVEKSVVKQAAWSLM